jgi:hypothetical protein
MTKSPTTKKELHPAEGVSSPADTLQDLLTGRRADVPAEGCPRVAIIYQSGPVRIHDSRTKGPVAITPEHNVLVDVELSAGGIVIERVRYGIGPRTWRFPSPSDPPPNKIANALYGGDKG